jgi:hypothetical protein
MLGRTHRLLASFPGVLFVVSPYRSVFGVASVDELPFAVLAGSEKLL